ncbi:hypothetical protein Trydic_g15142 [Trypoxylus dichotomus]
MTAIKFKPTSFRLDKCVPRFSGGKCHSKYDPGSSNREDIVPPLGPSELVRRHLEKWNNEIGGKLKVLMVVQQGNVKALLKHVGKQHHAEQ